MFAGLVLCIERKNLQSGKPSREYWVTTFFSKCQFMRSLKTQDHNWLRVDSKTFGIYEEESTTYG